MAARLATVTPRRRACVAISAMLLLAGIRGDVQVAASRAAQAPPAAAPPTRIVSLVPAVTETLFAIGAGPLVVGVSNFDTFPPEVGRLPRVGALLDPDTEKILTLRPDLVITYGSQADARTRFERAGIRVYSYRHGGISAVTESLRDLGRLTGRGEAAAAVATRIANQLAGIRASVSGLKRPKTVLVIERQPGTLRGMYVSGGSGFLDEMLDVAGGSNAFADVTRESMQPSHEVLLARAPEVIIEVRAQGSGGATAQDRAAWAVLPSLPAVRNGRLHLLHGAHLVLPGPRLAEGAAALARVLHPEVFKPK
jgi:iron complex transport system substrate-binding protein